jgi:lipooligosaccharide transport system permease protein
MSGDVSLPHALAVWRRNAAMYRRTWKLNLLPNFFEPLLYLASIGIGVGSYVSSMGGVSYVQFLAPGLVAVAAMNGATFEVTYNVFVRMNFEKAYDAMLTTPVQPDDVLVGELLWAMTRACIYGGSFLVVIAALGLCSFPSLVLALPVIPLGGLLFAALGLAVSLRVPALDVFNFYFTLFLTPLFLFSDVFFPLAERLPVWGQWLAEALPLLHPVRLARAAFRLDYGWIHLWDVIYILGFSALLLRSARRAVRARLVS